MLALLALLSACATPTPAPPKSGASELEAVPFFPQAQYQCGPAALATVLVHSGVATTPAALVPQVYLPGRQGSLQLELMAAARRAGRIAYTLDTTAQALLAELEAGHPVLVMQNLGLESAPRWHYAVVIGYQPEQQRVVLRSGTQYRKLESWRAFMGSWARAEFWGLVIPPSGELPASSTADAIGPYLAGQEGQLDPAILRAAWEKALARWPQDPDLMFATANARRSAAEPESAAALYRRLLLQAPEHMPARNNFADLLLSTGCRRAAATIIGPAVSVAQRLSPAARDAIISTSAAIANHLSRPSPDPEYCRALIQGLS